MIQSAFNTNIPGAFIGGVPAMGLSGTPYIGGVDIDPITPGVQVNPGVLTATGPSRTVANLGIMPQGMLTTAFGGMRRSGIGMGMGVDLDPITPGVQTQPGIVTPVGPPRIVGGPGFAANMRISGMLESNIRGTGISGGNAAFAGGALGGIIDADPITPGIQSQPGIVTPLGPPVIIGGQGAIGRSLSGALGGTVLTPRMIGSRIIDADPITPGIQTQPGVVTPVGPTLVQGYGSGLFGNRTTYGAYCCPWWLWIILSLLLLGGLLGGLYVSHYNSKDNSLNGVKIITTQGKNTTKTLWDDDDTDNSTFKNQNSNDETQKTTVTVNETSTASVPIAPVVNNVSQTAANQTTTTTTTVNKTQSTHPQADHNTTIAQNISQQSANTQVQTPHSNTIAITTSTASTTSTTSNQQQNNSNQTQGQNQGQTQTQTQTQTQGQTKSQNQSANQNELNNSNNQNNSNGQNSQNQNAQNSQTNNSANSNRASVNRRNKLRYLKRIVTRTTFSNQVVDPLLSDPKYKHLRRSQI